MVNEEACVECVFALGRWTTALRRAQIVLLLARRLFEDWDQREREHAGRVHQKVVWLAITTAIIAPFRLKPRPYILQVTIVRPNENANLPVL